MPLNYPPESFESALLEGGIEQVRKVIADRFKGETSEWMKFPEYVRAALSCVYSDDGELVANKSALTDRAWEDGWRGVAEFYFKVPWRPLDDRHIALAKRLTAELLGFIPAFSLLKCCGGAPKEELYKIAREMHGRLSFEVRLRGSKGDIIRSPKRELGQYLGQLREAVRGGAGFEVGCSARVHSIVNDVRRSSAELGQDLPPQFDILCELIEEALNDPETSPAVRRDIALRLEFLRSYGSPSIAYLRRVWQEEIPESSRKAIGQAKYRLHRRNRLNHQFIAYDPAYRLSASELAFEASPEKKMRRERTIALAQDLVRWSSLRATHGQGRPDGKGHKFVLDAFRLYGIWPDYIDSGAYLNKQRTANVR